MQAIGYRLVVKTVHCCGDAQPQPLYHQSIAGVGDGSPAKQGLDVVDIMRISHCLQARKRGLPWAAVAGCWNTAAAASTAVPMCLPLQCCI